MTMKKESSPILLVKKKRSDHRTIVRVHNTAVGGPESILMVDLCASTQGDRRLLTVLKRLSGRGARAFGIGRAPSPSFQAPFGKPDEALLRRLRRAARAHGLLLIAEAADPDGLSRVLPYADLLRIHADDMQNYDLLRAVGRCRKPVLLQRAPGATLEEWLWAAEYVLAGGNPNVILCERGIRALPQSHARLSLDLTSVPALKARAHLPVVVDLGEAPGAREQVPPLAQAGLAVGADGLILRVHAHGEGERCGDPAALTGRELANLVGKLASVAEAVGRPFALPSRRKEGGTREVREAVAA